MDNFIPIYLYVIKFIIINFINILNVLSWWGILTAIEVRCWFSYNNFRTLFFYDFCLWHLFLNFFLFFLFFWFFCFLLFLCFLRFLLLGRLNSFLMCFCHLLFLLLNHFLFDDFRQLNFLLFFFIYLIVFSIEFDHGVMALDECLGLKGLSFVPEMY